MSRFLEDYDPVEVRIEHFYKDHPEGYIYTDLIQRAAEKGERWIVKAFVYRNGEDAGTTGYAFEVDGEGNVNRTSALENCETSAIGRALANLGYAAKGKRPSREEMSKALRQQDSPRREARSSRKEEPTGAGGTRVWGSARDSSKPAPASPTQDDSGGVTPEPQQLEQAPLAGASAVLTHDQLIATYGRTAVLKAANKVARDEGWEKVPQLMVDLMHLDDTALLALENKLQAEREHGVLPV